MPEAPSVTSSHSPRPGLRSCLSLLLALTLSAQAASDPQAIDPQAIDPQARDPAAGDPDGGAAAEAPTPPTTLAWLWGDPHQDSLYLGMWSIHLRSGSRDNREEHHLAGLTRDGYFGGTFLNSHNDRVWSAGVHRKLDDRELGSVQIRSGYRLGLMHGYDDKLTHLAGKTPLFPVLQLTLDASVENVGVQLSWAGSVVAGGFFYRF